MTLPTGDIAVIGLAFHVPGATSKDQFWKNLLAGRDCLTRSTEQTLNRKGLPWSRIGDPRCRLVAPSISDRQYVVSAILRQPTIRELASLLS